jgi:hypothetical protein
MVTLIRQVFTRSYWRLVSRRQFWRDSWFALRRIHKDKRVRPQIKLLSQVILAPLVFFAVLLWILAMLATAMTGEDAAPALGGFLFLTMLVLRLSFRRRRVVYRQGPTWADERLYRPTVRREVAELTLLYAVLADRASSEVFVAVKTLPDQIEVVTRQLHIALLRKHNLWERLGPEEKALLMLPDGGWEAGVTQHVAERALEPLRILRWALRVDPYLPSVGSDASVDYKLAKELVLNPEKIMAGYDLIDRQNLEAVRLSADNYFQRGVAEGLTRGFFLSENEQNLVWAKNIAQQLGGRQAKDLVVGAKLIGETDESTVRLVTSIAQRRVQTCDWLIGVLSGKEMVGEVLRLVI